MNTGKDTRVFTDRKLKLKGCYRVGLPDNNHLY